jgi:CHAT domain-containing protein/Tfp pilus assembly protein PilF
LLQGGIVFAGLNWFGFEIRQFAALNLLLAVAWVAVVCHIGKRYSERTGTRCLAARVPAARRALRSWLAVPRAVLVRGATAWFAVVIGLAGVSASVPADAGGTEVFSGPRTFAAPEHVCEALPESNYNPGVPLLRGSPLTDESFVERLRAATRALVFCTLSVSAPSHGQDALDASGVMLADGVPVTRSQRADEPLAYAFDAQRGQTLLIEVEQHGLDVIVSVQEPSGEIKRFNSPLLRSESEVVLVDDAIAGRYRVTVVSEEPTNASGSHTIALSSLDARARQRYGGALREMSEGARANAESQFAESLRHYERSTLLWREVGDVRRQAQSQYGEAMLLYWSLRDWRPAADRAMAAANLYKQSGEQFLHANALLTKGYSLMEIASAGTEEDPSIFEQALTALHESAALHQAMGNDYELAVVENFTGLTYFYRGRADAQDFREAEKHYRRSADLFARLGEWREELNARHNLALISIDEGYATNAARALEDILADIPAGKDPDFRGSVLANLGVAYRDSGNYDAALVALSEAATIYSSLKNLNFEAYSLRVLGTTYQALGELERADQFLRQALEKAVERGRVRSAILSGLGTVAYQKGDYAAALDWHEQSVQSTTSTVDRAYRQGFVVRDLVALRHFDEAIMAGVEVLSGADTPAISKADAALELGHAYLGLNQGAKADESFAMALEVYDAARIANKQAEALNGRALAARASGDLAAAIQFGEQSLQRIESLRAGVSSPELRAFYSAAQSDYYETQIELLLDAAHAGSAFEPRYLSEALSVSERARARMIVDLLSEAAVRLDSGTHTEDVIERERRLYDELGALRYQRDRLLERPNVEAAALEPLVRRMIAIENEISLASIAARAGDTSAGVATPLAAAEIQASLDEGSVLLQYSLGSPNSLAWVVTRASLHVVELADRATIEAAARKVYDGLKSYRPDRSSSALATTRAELADLVIAPILPFVNAGEERLIVAADGALDYVPFGVLPFSLNGETVPLLQAFEVTNVPSMSAVAAQRRRAVQPAPKTLAVFADPVFAATDARLPSGDSDVVTAVAGPFPQAPVRLERLPATGVEANAIGDLVSHDQRLILTGFDASREGVLDAPLRDYRMVHFATHGLVDSRYPGLSALAFSQFDPAGRPQNGLLRLQDIYRLDLNADFVVLSGCETALGREIRGEGLIGLADGFLYAGARSLVVSLWQVPDRATAELMTRFYGYVLKDSLRPAEALRRAQRSIAAEQRWSDPYFWGAFVVLGDL